MRMMAMEKRNDVDKNPMKSIIPRKCNAIGIRFVEPRTPIIIKPCHVKDGGFYSDLNIGPGNIGI